SLSPIFRTSSALAANSGERVSVDRSWSRYDDTFDSRPGIAASSMRGASDGACVAATGLTGSGALSVSVSVGAGGWSGAASFMSVLRSCVPSYAVGGWWGRPRERPSTRANRAEPACAGRASISTTGGLIFTLSGVREGENSPCLARRPGAPTSSDESAPARGSYHHEHRRPRPRTRPRARGGARARRRPARRAPRDRAARRRPARRAALGRLGGGPARLPHRARLAQGPQPRARPARRRLRDGDREPVRHGDPARPRRRGARRRRGLGGRRPALRPLHRRPLPARGGAARLPGRDRPRDRADVRLRSGAPSRTRTCNLRIRRPLLYPLSYRGARPS